MCLRCKVHLANVSPLAAARRLLDAPPSNNGVTPGGITADADGDNDKQDVAIIAAIAVAAAFVLLLCCVLICLRKTLCACWRKQRADASAAKGPPAPEKMYADGRPTYGAHHSASTAPSATAAASTTAASIGTNRDSSIGTHLFDVHALAQRRAQEPANGHAGGAIPEPTSESACGGTEVLDVHAAVAPPLAVSGGESAVFDVHGRPLRSAGPPPDGSISLRNMHANAAATLGSASGGGALMASRAAPTQAAMQDDRDGTQVLDVHSARTAARRELPVGWDGARMVSRAVPTRPLAQTDAAGTQVLDVHALAAQQRNGASVHGSGHDAVVSKQRGGTAARRSVHEDDLYCGTEVFDVHQIAEARQR